MFLEEWKLFLVPSENVKYIVVEADYTLLEVHVYVLHGTRIQKSIESLISRVSNNFIGLVGKQACMGFDPKKVH